MSERVDNELLAYDRTRLDGHEAIMGVDEAGRGPLAGPVVAGAVRLGSDFYAMAEGLPAVGEFNDSKQLKPERREVLFAQLCDWREQGLMDFTVASAGVEDIEALNILGATRKAMAEAIWRLDVSGALILIDGRPHKHFPYAHEGLVKGDAHSLAIAMASVAAKVTRDRHMEALARDYPLYGFEQHKGYGTKAHQAALLAHGPCPEHRALFLRKLLAQVPAEA